ncbi:hypothetical protein AXK11_00185 [Cephaloticoccus primus]|uniref:PIN domain-containing protein n=1 Tax=Cephaloticoccus primus TaxID=1548207 RepID=A0A139ST83_9BACT|nr:PIN domain-containing protein [Cephaloticoccus primus]KXU37691.1 hypothetical protein AXK11_00185 [Cephaloticoccus primus]
MQTFHTPESTWDLVLKIATELERAGTRVLLPDLIIAACALEAGATVLTLDSDFSRIPDLKVIHTLE